VILFDLDGVLVDSSAAIGQSVEHALRETGRPVPERSVVDGLIGMPLHEMFERLGCDSGEAVDACVAAYRAEYAEVALERTTVVAGIPAVLEALSRRHDLAVATTKPIEFAEPILARLGLDRFFAGVFGPSLAARGESKVTTLSRATAALAPRRPVALVGDRNFDVLAARHAKITAVGVLWGYGDREELEDAGAHVIVTEPADLLAVDFSGRPDPLDAEVAEDRLRDVQPELR
jgi:phosphoglycolate phosphatase